jgi:hypothetical protein
MRDAREGLLRLKLRSSVFDPMQRIRGKKDNLSTVNRAEGTRCTHWLVYRAMRFLTRSPLLGLSCSEEKECGSWEHDVQLSAHGSATQLAVADIIWCQVLLNFTSSHFGLRAIARRTLSTSIRLQFFYSAMTNKQTVLCVFPRNISLLPLHIAMANRFQIPLSSGSQTHPRLVGTESRMERSSALYSVAIRSK